jgi:hypothetical protein
MANISYAAMRHIKHEFSYLKPENSCFIFRSALPKLQLCHGHSTYLPATHIRAIPFHRLTEAPREPNLFERQQD